MTLLFDSLDVGRRFSMSFVFVLICFATASSHAGFVTFEAAGFNAAAITPTRDAFRAAVGGGSVAGPDGSLGGLRREINWDDVPEERADPNALPGNFFNTTSPRGVVLSTPRTGFLVGAERLFTAVNSNITAVSLFVADTTISATTSAFGVIFVDAEIAGLTRVRFLDQNNSLLDSRDTLSGGNRDLSFVGAVADKGERISRVEITSGLNTIVSNCVLGNPNDDVVVMDDLLFGEPVAAAVPEPSSLALAGLGLLGGSPSSVVAARVRDL
jgi:hypothetical protein